MIVCKSPAEIEKMRRAGHVVRQVLEAVRAMIAPGVSTMDLELAAEAKIAEMIGNIGAALAHLANTDSAKLLTPEGDVAFN